MRARRRQLSELDQVIGRAQLLVLGRAVPPEHTVFVTRFCDGRGIVHSSQSTELVHGRMHDTRRHQVRPDTVAIALGLACEQRVRGRVRLVIQVSGKHDRPGSPGLLPTTQCIQLLHDDSRLTRALKRVSWVPEQMRCSHQHTAITRRKRQGKDQHDVTCDACERGCALGEHGFIESHHLSEHRGTERGTCAWTLSPSNHKTMLLLFVATLIHIVVPCPCQGGADVFQGVDFLKAANVVL